jgi:hypothetical protein
MKKNLPILVGIALPIIMVLIIAALTVIPTFKIQPEHDFIFATGTNDYYNSYYKFEYEIKEGKIQKVSSSYVYPNNYTKPNDLKEMDSPDLYLYEVKTERLRKISFEEAQQYVIDQGPTSVDGYNVDFGYRGNYGIGDLFGSSRDNYNAYITKGDAVKGINISVQNQNYYSGYSFIGWIK